MKTAVEWLFNELWDTPKDKLTWHTILEKAKEMGYKQTMEAIQKGMELQESYGSKQLFIERNGLNIDTKSVK
tara:strand:+ start:461 stop:676 length:216 start_codon:yes stop_codon:yes gene_type:complete